MPPFATTYTFSLDGIILVIPLYERIVCHSPGAILRFAKTDIVAINNTITV
jgi:hypothetical protein